MPNQNEPPKRERLPDPPGDPVILSKDTYLKMREAIEAATVLFDTRNFIVKTGAKGQVVKLKRNHIFTAPFEVRQKDPGTPPPKVRLEPGYITETHPKIDCADCTIEHTPTIGGVAMDAPQDLAESKWSYPWLAVAVGDYVYLIHETDPDGQIIVTAGREPRIEASATQKDSIHHVPLSPDGNGDVDGFYYTELFQVAAAPFNSLEFTPSKWSGDFPYDKALWMGKNVGAAAGEVFKRYDCDEDRWHFRTLDGEHGIITATNALQVDIHFDAQNIGTSGQEVYKNDAPPGPPPTAKAEFRKIDERLTNPQINVGRRGEIIEVKGNNYDAARDFVCKEDGSRSQYINVVDGLVTFAADIVACCSCSSYGGGGP